MAQPAPATTGARPLGKPRGWVVVVLLSIVTLAIFIGFVNPFIMSAEVGNLYAAEGQEKPVSGITGLWILLPIVGTFIWLAKTQNALSAFWEAHGAVRP